MKQAIRINPTDNVAVAIKALKAGDIIDIEGSPLKLVTDVVPGHKIALNDIKTGEMIVKYGLLPHRSRHPRHCKRSTAR